MAMALQTKPQPYLLELDGRLAGRFFTSTGGGVTADVVVKNVGSGQFSHKYLDAVHIGIECGTGMSRAFYDWVGSSFGGATVRKTGAVITLDQASKPAARLDFYNALVVSLVLPGLDRSATAGATMAVTLKAEQTSWQKSGGTLDLGVYASSLPKAWNISAFRIQIDGLNTDCTHVTRISPLTLGMKTKTDSFGSERNPTLAPGAVEFSNIALELPGTSAEGFTKWHQDSVVKGNPSTRNGSVEFFAPGSSTPYFSVKLNGLGIYKLSSRGPSKTALPVTVSLYCEQMSFSAGAAAMK